MKYLIITCIKIVNVFYVVKCYSQGFRMPSVILKGPLEATAREDLG